MKKIIPTVIVALGSWNVNLLQCLELSLGASGLRFVTGSNLSPAGNAVRRCCCTKSKANQSV